MKKAFIYHRAEEYTLIVTSGGDGFVLELNHQVTNGWVARKGESLRQNDNGKWEIVRKGK